MSTAKSPVAVLQKQADECAKQLKRGVRGELRRFPKKDRITFGVVMDDKLIKVDIAWDVLVDTDEAALSAMILREMQEKKQS